ncbi:chitin synthase-domain-containing protein [Xylariales sp. PMI_506]|nr:chitin synthase-domain-containing protein [Xylariales sp. PMI_506]
MNMSFNEKPEGRPVSVDRVHMQTSYNGTPRQSVQGGQFYEEANISVNYPPTPSYNEKRIEELGHLVTRVNEQPKLVDVDGSLTKRGKLRMSVNKVLFGPGLILFNAFLLFGSWWFPDYFYAFLPFIAWGVMINFIVVITLCLWLLFRYFFPEKYEPAPEVPESLLFIVPCYNESEDELRRSLDSLVEQVDIEQHPHGIVIICDGRVRSPGMSDTTANCLLNTILTHRTSRRLVSNAYLSWDKQDADIILQRGTYCEVPYMCIIKLENSGKRDGLILIRSFAWNFNNRLEKPATILSPALFGEMASFVLDDCGVAHIDALVGMDADTVFDPICVSELIKESRYPRTVGVCGVVSVDFRKGDWNYWRLMQHASYSVSQALPRLHQSIVTHKVTCLPGCCQLLKVCEETCSDFILRETFGYSPTPKDGMLRHLRASYSEDRNHVVNMLVKRPKVQTRQAFRALAWTDVPASLSVFLSQRKRWSLGATVNDLILLTSWNTQWFERFRASANLSIWFCNIFILGSIAGLVHAATKSPWYVTLGFCGAVIVPYCYMACLVLWMPRTLKLKVQYAIGLVLYLFTSPFLTIGTLLYALYHLNHFGWGKTRRTIDVETDSTTGMILFPDGQGSYNTTAAPSQNFAQSGLSTPYENIGIYDEEGAIGITRPARVYL